MKARFYLQTSDIPHHNWNALNALLEGLRPVMIQADTADETIQHMKAKHGAR